MNLNDYRGKMGKLIDAGALLRAIYDPENPDREPAGSDMRVPNITVAPAEEVRVDLAAFYLEGETLTYSIEVENETIAIAKVDDVTKMLIVTGKVAGTTTATIKAGDEGQTIAITVRKSGNSSGWM